MKKATDQERYGKGAGNAKTFVRTEYTENAEGRPETGKLGNANFQVGMTWHSSGNRETSWASEVSPLVTLR